MTWTLSISNFQLSKLTTTYMLTTNLILLISNYTARIGFSLTCTACKVNGNRNAQPCSVPRTASQNRNAPQPHSVARTTLNGKKKELPKKLKKKNWRRLKEEICNDENFSYCYMKSKVGVWSVEVEEKILSCHRCSERFTAETWDGNQRREDGIVDLGI